MPSCFPEWFYQTVCPPAVIRVSDVPHLHQYSHLSNFPSFKEILTGVNDLFHCEFVYFLSVVRLNFSICLSSAWSFKYWEECYSLQLVDLLVSLSGLSVFASCILKFLLCPCIFRITMFSWWKDLLIPGNVSYSVYFPCLFINIATPAFFWLFFNMVYHVKDCKVPEILSSWKVTN